MSVSQSLQTLGLMVLLSLTACQPEAPLPDAPDGDDVLMATLLEALGQEGVDALRMPHPDDLTAIPQDPKNPLTADKVNLGRLLFHETGLGTQPGQSSGMETYSCASCHHAAAGFQAGLQQGLGDGAVGFGLSGEGRVRSADYLPEEVDRQPMRTPTAMNGAFTPVTLWNGQFGATGPNAGTEAQWADGTPLEVNHLGYMGMETQAIAGLGVHRLAPTPEFFDAQPKYVTLFDADEVAVIDPERLEVVAVIPTGRGPFDITIIDRPGLRRAYVTLFESNAVAVIELDPESVFYHQEIARVP